MRFNNLNDWLIWQETLNPAEIELGLERVSQVLKKMGHSSTFDCPLITVAGTNGKGSVVAMLEAIAIAAGVNVCSYTSPHLFNYTERIKINGQPVDDEKLCEAFQHIDDARQGSPLTYFEFGTLAAIELFFAQKPDLVILEVGLGGRLDAVNIMDADVSVLTSVSIDHVDWLGSDRETIGVEKAGIIRSGKPVIYGEYSPPDSVVDLVKKLDCKMIQAGRDYDVELSENHWHLTSAFGALSDLPPPSLAGKFQYLNAATAISALQALPADGSLVRLSENESNNSFRKFVVNGLQQINLPGRFQQVYRSPSVYVDVAHNIQAAHALASQIDSSSRQVKNVNKLTAGKNWAIVAMLSDKDAEGVVEAMSAQIDNWCFAGLNHVPRGLSSKGLIDMLSKQFISGVNLATNQQNQCTITQHSASGNNILQAESVSQACEWVLKNATQDDRVIIFGSFYTVAEATRFFSELDESCG